MSNELYIPQGCKSMLEADPNGRIRLGLQSSPFGGKTTSAMTFPNPVVLSYDNKLGGFIGRPDIIEVPFYSGQYVDSIKKRDGVMAKPNQKEALQIWLANEAPKFSAEQTLVVDGSTGIEVAFHSYMDDNP